MAPCFEGVRWPTTLHAEYDGQHRAGGGRVRVSSSSSTWESERASEESGGGAGGRGETGMIRAECGRMACQLGGCSFTEASVPVPGHITDAHGAPRVVAASTHARLPRYVSCISRATISQAAVSEWPTDAVFPRSSVRGRVARHHVILPCVDTSSASAHVYIIRITRAQSISAAVCNPPEPKQYVYVKSRNKLHLVSSPSLREERLQHVNLEPVQHQGTSSFIHYSSKRE